MQNDGVDKRDTETIFDEALGDRRSLIYSWELEDTPSFGEFS
jgi:hypothetical protein